MTMLLFLLAMLLARICNGQGTITVTTKLSTISSTKTITQSEIFESTPPVSSITLTTTLITATSSTSYTPPKVIIPSTAPETSELTVWSVWSTLPTTDSNGRSTTISSLELFTLSG
jgi:hypothetical protein